MLHRSTETSFSFDGFLTLPFSSTVAKVLDFSLFPGHLKLTGSSTNSLRKFYHASLPSSDVFENDFSVFSISFGFY